MCIRLYYGTSEGASGCKQMWIHSRWRELRWKLSREKKKCFYLVWKTYGYLKLQDAISLIWRDRSWGTSQLVCNKLTCTTKTLQWSNKFKKMTLCVCVCVFQFPISYFPRSKAHQHKINLSDVNLWGSCWQQWQKVTITWEDKTDKTYSTLLYV